MTDRHPRRNSSADGTTFDRWNRRPRRIILTPWRRCVDAPRAPLTPVLLSLRELLLSAGARLMGAARISMPVVMQMEQAGRSNPGSQPPQLQDAAVNPNNLAATAIYDLQSPEVRSLAAKLRASCPDDRLYLQAAHAHLSDTNMLTVYSIDDEQPASVTLRENKGACAQRMAALEALARAAGIATRVRALWLAKAFWFGRLPLLRWVLPDAVLYTWPQFRLGGNWVDFDELYAPMEALVARASGRFSNSGESIFSAVRDQPVDFLGKSSRCGCPEFDLSPIVASDAGLFDTREQLFASQNGRPGLFGRALFNLLYGGRPIRRTEE